MITVLKLGGSTLDGGAPTGLLEAIAARAHAGERLLIVHGGGKTLTALLQKLGAGTQFRHGLRVTDAATLEAAVMALAGSVNTRLVAALNRALQAKVGAARAVGLTGLDGGSLKARRADPGLGYVGESQPGNPQFLHLLLDADYLPVLASLAPEDPGGALLNVNADIFAASCAALLGADCLTFVTDVAGVLDCDGRRLDEVRLSELESLLASGQISGGMLPKLQACRLALEAGVGRVEILGAEALLLQTQGAYPHTRILPSPEVTRA